MARTLPAPCHTCGRVNCVDHGARARDVRATSAKRGYGGRWRTVREIVLGSEPWCRRCWDAGRSVEAVHVHHRTKKAHGGADDAGELIEVETKRGSTPRWNGNLEPLCHSCHSSATARGE